MPIKYKKAGIEKYHQEAIAPNQEYFNDFTLNIGTAIFRSAIGTMKIGNVPI